MTIDTTLVSTKHYVFTDKGIYTYFLGKSKFMLYLILASKF